MYSWQQPEDEDEEEEVQHGGGKSLTLFLVDANTAMGERREGDPDGYTALQRALCCAHDTIKNKIFTSDQDHIGVVLFGCRPLATPHSDFKTVRVLLPLGRPSGGAILQLERLLGEQGAATLEAEVGCGGVPDARLDEALWQCQSLFAGVPGKVATKSVLLLTCRSAPHGQDTLLDGKARRKAMDLHNTDVCLDVIPVVGPGETFDKDRFYTDLVRLAEDDVSLGITPLEELSESVLRKTTVKRSNGRMKLDLGGTVIAVSSFNLTRKVNKPTKQRMTADTNDEVVTSRRWVHPVTGAPLLPSDMNSFQTYGGKRIKLTTDEVKAVKSLGGDQTYLKLCGFKPLDCLKLQHHVRASHFLYPHEETIKGSRTVFSALLQRCAARRVVAVCQYKPRTTAEMSYVALLPQEEESAGGGGQARPPGFHVIYLPFLDDLRKLPRLAVDSSLRPAPAAVTAAKEIIAKLKLKKFQPVESVTLQSHYRMIEAHALKKTTLTPPEDDTVPDLDRMTRKLGKRSQDFLTQVYDEGYNPDALPAKKAAPKKEAGVKESRSGGEVDMEKCFNEGTIPKLTVDQLKCWLKSRGIVAGTKKKAELVAMAAAQF